MEFYAQASLLLVPLVLEAIIIGYLLGRYTKL